MGSSGWRPWTPRPCVASGSGPRAAPARLRRRGRDHPLSLANTNRRHHFLKRTSLGRKKMMAAAGPAADLLVVGGGINGAGIARDAAGRGLSVVLCEQGDLAAATSSASTKLIHGGLRYLEYYEFRLVREALFERERLLESAPHIIWPLRFILPYEKGIRPAWFVRLGLFLYDHLAPRKKLPGTEGIKLTRHPAGQALKPGFDTAFAYSDCWVEDSRMVALNAVDAFEDRKSVV